MVHLAVLALALPFTLASPAFLRRDTASCGVLGYGTGAAAYYYGQSATTYPNAAACGAICKADSNCKSFAFSTTNECLLYAAGVSGNFASNSASPYSFYDVACLTSPSCGVVGYDKGTPASYYYDGNTADANFASCSAVCKSQSQCASFAYGSGSCLLYTAAVSVNVNKVSGSPYTFNDVGCSSSSSAVPSLPSSSSSKATSSATSSVMTSSSVTSVKPTSSATSSSSSALTSMSSSVLQSSSLATSKASSSTLATSTTSSAPPVSSSSAACVNDQMFQAVQQMLAANPSICTDFLSSSAATGTDYPAPQYSSACNCATLTSFPSATAAASSNGSPASVAAAPTPTA